MDTYPDSSIGGPAVTVSQAAWVDTGSFRPNQGQFPIRVERHLNSFVGAHLPGVTTVTNATRYYALHGLIARIAQDEALDEAGTIDLLRRSEALLACVTRVHSTSSDTSHDKSTPAPHGIDAIMRSARTSSGFDLTRASEVYSDAKWAFSGPYRGSELTLKILAPGAFTPGEWYDDTRARAVLEPLVDAARSTDNVTDAELADLSSACLCTTPSSSDGAWIAELLSGDDGQSVDRPTVGGLLWQFGRMAAVAMTVGQVTNADTLADLVMFDPMLREHPSLSDMVAPQRWRGALLRKESVYAWRLIWRSINDLVGGERAVDDLAAAFVDQLPAESVSDFVAALPGHLDVAGRPRPAERELDHMPDIHGWLACLMLGADRLNDLAAEELRGFRGAEEHAGGVWEELSPGWVAEKLVAYADRSVRDLGQDFAVALINRSQRVALWKSRFDARTQILSFPARLHVRDGIAVQVFPETAPVPATRIPQYLSITRQAGMFVADGSGGLTIGPNGGHLG